MGKSRTLSAHGLANPATRCRRPGAATRQRTRAGDAGSPYSQYPMEK
jgi:hypothetical protein